VVCAVNGAAAGGGVGLALAADMVIAARSAYFYLPFAPALGLVPDMGSSWFLPRALGPARALGLALTGEKLPAQQAADWGLIWACVDDGRLAEEAQRLAAQLAALPAHVIGEIRALFAAAGNNTFTQQLALERDRQALLADGESFAEGLRAFAERRKPFFRGRG
jgi:2-(1,2-epoxy-1,2-dihydrophenyl)acetyl-CoA isomerase